MKIEHRRKVETSMSLKPNFRGSFESYPEKFIKYYISFGVWIEWRIYKHDNPTDLNYDKKNEPLGTLGWSGHINGFPSF